jgi:hypothetical protein
MVGIPQIRRYLVVTSHEEFTIFQLFGGKVCQNIGNISGNIGPGRERNSLVAVSTNGHFPTRDIEVEVALVLWLTRRKRNARAIKRRTASKGDPTVDQCRRRHMGYLKLSAGPEHSPSSRTFPQFQLPIYLRTPKE